MPWLLLKVFSLLHSALSNMLRVSISAGILTPDFPNLADFRQLQIQHQQTKYYENLTISTETFQNAIR